MTALAQNPTQFSVAQVVTRSFIITAAITSFVMVSEEFPAANPGWGIGILAGVGAIGCGVGTLVYAFVGRLPFGRRARYAIGLLPVIFLPARARGLSATAIHPDTRDGDRERSAAAAFLPIMDMLRQHPRRALPSP